MKHNQYSIYETKAHLSRILKEVQECGEVVVTERGCPKYRIVPFTQPKTTKELYQALVAKGIIDSKGPVKTLPVGKKRPGALKRFLDERE